MENLWKNNDIVKLHHWSPLFACYTVICFRQPCMTLKGTKNLTLTLSLINKFGEILKLHNKVDFSNSKRHHFSTMQLKLPVAQIKMMANRIERSSFKSQITAMKMKFLDSLVFLWFEKKTFKKVNVLQPLSVEQTLLWIATCDISFKFKNFFFWWEGKKVGGARSDTTKSCALHECTCFWRAPQKLLRFDLSFSQVWPNKQVTTLYNHVRLEQK